jgi:hypothetical protein
MRFPLVLVAVVATTCVRAAPHPQLAGLLAPMSGGEATTSTGLSGQQNGAQSTTSETPNEGGRGGDPMATGPMGVPLTQAGAPKQPNQGGVAASNNSRCAADVDRLASGIQQNILDQQGEQFSLQAVMKLLQNSTGNVDMTQFMTTKAQLLSYVTAGISIRENNQAIAPPTNAALPGLGKVSLMSMKPLRLDLLTNFSS